MTLTHPIGEEWIMALAGGTLSEGEDVFVRTHLDLNPEGRNLFKGAEIVAGAFFDQIEESPVSPALKETVMGLLGANEDEGTSEDKACQPAVSGEVTPKSLRTFIGGDLDSLKWTWLGPGLRKARLWTSKDDQRLWLLRAEPGARVPMHGHRGTELTLVLKGAFKDGDRRYTRGDVEECDGSHEHTVEIETGEECICLALTEGPVRLKGLAARLVQPFIGL